MFLGAPADTPWSDDDRAWALALLQVEAATCSGCDHDLADGTDPDGEFSWAAEAVRCHACAAIEREAAKFEDHAGLRFTVRRR